MASARSCGSQRRRGAMSSQSSSSASAASTAGTRPRSRSATSSGSTTCPARPSGFPSRGSRPRAPRSVLEPVRPSKIVRRPADDEADAAAKRRGEVRPVRRGRERTMASGDHARLFGVLGDPVDHSLSPAMHNAAFAATGLPYLYLRYRVAPAALATALAEARALGMGGLTLTVPLKEPAIPVVDRLTEAADSAVG